MLRISHTRRENITRPVGRLGLQSRQEEEAWNTQPPRLLILHLGDRAILTGGDVAIPLAYHSKVKIGLRHQIAGDSLGITFTSAEVFHPEG
jgi:hypothetical protein